MPKLAVVAISIILLVFAFALLTRVSLRWIFRVHLARQVDTDRNTAVGIEAAGFMLGMFLVAGAVLGHARPGTFAAGLEAAVVGIAGIALLSAFGRLGLRVLVATDIAAGTRANNIAAGMVGAGAHVGVGMVIAGALSSDGQGGSWGASAVFLLLGLAVFLLISKLYRALTVYDDDAEIARGNVAVAIGYAGLLIAMGILVRHAVEGSFIDWRTSLWQCLLSLCLCGSLYFVRQFVVQSVLLGGSLRLRGGLLDDEIALRRNIGAAAIEAASFIGAAVLLLGVGI